MRSVQGGRRSGAGRKKGVPNKVTAEIRRKILESGKSPLEMVRWIAGEFVAAAGMTQDNDTRLSLLERAAAIEKDALPYLHAKLQSIELTGTNAGPIKTETTLTVEEAYLRMVRGK